MQETSELSQSGPMARRIVQRHQGQIWAEAAPDQEASFSFLIPDL